MYLNLLQLENYRNYVKIEIDFGKSTNLIIGENGQGKTNLLESIYFLSTGRSHRNSPQNDLIRWETDYSVIRSRFEDDDSRKRNIAVEIRRDTKNKVKIDGAVSKNISSLASIIPSVIFTPEDMKIIKSGPSHRRDFLDQISDKTVTGYSRIKSSYNKILNQRNSLLKTLNDNVRISPGSTLDVWDEKLSEYGSKIISTRLEIFGSLSKAFIEKFRSFFKMPDIKADYILSWERRSKKQPRERIDTDQPSIYRTLLDEIRRYRKDDLRFKNSSIGPHRDDFNICIAGKDIRSFGSQGQQRTAAIALKLAELGYIKEILKKKPILLLDDVLSELDTERQKILLDNLAGKSQTFITSTGNIDIKELSPYRTYEIKNGMVKDHL